MVMITILISNFNKQQIDENKIHPEEVAESALEKLEDNSLQVSIKTSDFFSYLRYELICIRLNVYFIPIAVQWSEWGGRWSFSVGRIGSYYLLEE